MGRLTQKEKRAETRRCLMHSAAQAFSRKGLQQTSIDEVAEDAGFTKGAFYANFRNKEELFLAMLDEKFAAKMEQIEAVISGEGTDMEKASRAGDDFAEMMSADPEWQRLFLEFCAYAGRNEEFRQELVTRHRWMRDRVAAALETRAQAIGFTPPIPAAQVALMTFAMAHGVALENILEPDDVPQDLFGTMLQMFFTGIQAQATSS